MVMAVGPLTNECNPPRQHHTHQIQKQTSTLFLHLPLLPRPFLKKYCDSFLLLGSGSSKITASAFLPHAVLPREMFDNLKAGKIRQSR